MFDGKAFSCRWGHSAGCVTLLDGTVVVSVFGGMTTRSYLSVVSNASFYQWSKSAMIVLREDDKCIVDCVYLLCSDPHQPNVLRSGLTPPGAVLCLTAGAEQQIGLLLCV